MPSRTSTAVPSLPSQLITRLRSALPDLALGLILVVAAWASLFSVFAYWDDEGYILFSVRAVQDGHVLYDEVFSQYGPAFQLLCDLLNTVTGPLTTNGVRVLALIQWVGTALVIQRIVAYQTTRGYAWLAAFACFAFLHFTPDEPFHPGPFVLCLLVLAVFVQQRRPNWSPWLLGAIGALLLLMKINVGVLFCLSVLLWQLRRLGRGWITLPQLALVALALLILLHARLSEPSVQLLFASVLIGAFNLLMTAPTSERGARPTPPWPELMRTLLAFAITSSLVLGWALLRGGNLSGLIDGVLLAPLRHAPSFFYALDWRPGTTLSLAASLLAVTLFRCGKLSPRSLGMLRGTALVALATSIILIFHVRTIGAVHGFCLPWLWLFCVDEHKANRVASLCAWLLLFQSLHAYPLAGIQVAWGAFLIFPLAALSPTGLIAPLALRSHLQPSTQVATLKTWASRGMLAAFILSLSLGFGSRVKSYCEGSPLEVPGGQWLRLPAERADNYRIIQRACAAHPGPVFSAPGLLSFNLWSERPTPTLRSTTLWWSLLAQNEQQAIQEELSGALLIVHDDFYDKVRTGEVPQTPLVKHILALERPALTTGDFKVFCERPLTLEDTARLSRKNDDSLLTLQVNLGEDIETIEVCDYQLGPHAPFIVRKLGRRIEPGETLNLGKSIYTLSSRSSLVSFYGRGHRFLGYAKVVE